jgi:indolepyruvate ferredoxin oxidoreductase beta subunit
MVLTASGVEIVAGKLECWNIGILGIEMRDKKFMKQQIVIGGVGGQGVLFVTRLLAEAAILKGFRVFTSETHGMAQRGGTVLSHLKVGSFSSPLIRAGNADGLLALKANSLIQHRYYLKPGGWTVVNTNQNVLPGAEVSAHAVDAERLAKAIQSPKSVNLILLGFALAVIPDSDENILFCGLEDIEAVLQRRLAKNKEMLDDAVKSLEAGFRSLK